MTGGDRQELDIPSYDDLDDFDTPKRRVAPHVSNDRKKQEIARATSFPSRESSDEGQLNMRASNAILDRFKAICKADRRKYADMLEILMDTYEKQSSKP